MNIIKINGVAYALPPTGEKLNGTLNHIDMCKKGLKPFVLLDNLDGETQKLSSYIIQNAKIHVTIEQQ